MKLWTDYPFKSTDVRGVLSVRKVSLVSYDGNKYVEIKYRGQVYSMKAGYLFTRKFKRDTPMYKMNRYAWRSPHYHNQ